MALSSLCLILMRHGEAGQHAASDHARSLTADGLAATDRVGQQLVKAISSPIKIICSDSTRTTQTSEQIIKHLKEHTISFDHELYVVTDPARLSRRISRVTTNFDQCVMVIGHNPAISLLGSELTGEWVSLSPSDCQILTIDCDDWGVALHSRAAWRQTGWISPNN